MSWFIARWASVAVVVLGLATGLMYYQGAASRAQARAAAAETLLQTNQAALEELRRERERTVAALEREAAAERLRADSYRSIRRSVDAAPPTNACVDTPAVRAALGGLRRAADTRNQGRAGGSAGGSAVVSSGAGNPAPGEQRR